MLGSIPQPTPYSPFGTFSTALDPTYSFGVREVEMSGILVDMDAVAQSLWARDNDAAVSKMVGQQTGMITSAFEHRIPELFFTNEQNPGEAVSAVKALALEAQQGQRIYQITSANVGVLDTLSIGEEVKDEIQAAIAVGREAMVSESTITVGDWMGVGYIISDSDTGSGAYRISGGENGAYFILAGLGAIRALLGVMLNTSTVILSFILLGVFLQLVILIAAIATIVYLTHEYGSLVGLAGVIAFLSELLAVFAFSVIAAAAAAGGVFLAILGVSTRPEVF